MQEAQLFESLTLAIPGLVWVCDEQGRIEFNNAHWADFTGMPQEHGLGHGWLAAIHPADAAAFRAQLPLVASADENFQAEIRVRRYDGIFHRHLLNVRRVGDGKWVGCAIDAHEWLTTELRDATQGNILELVIAGSPLEEVLSELCRAAEKQIPGATCSVLVVDSAKGYFTTGVGPKLPPSLMMTVSGVKIGTGEGACGTAAHEKRDVISIDIASDPVWDKWRDLISPLGFRTCWSKPVFASNGDVIASMGFYFRELREPTYTEQQELARLRGLASLAIERARMLEALRESEEHYRHTVEQSPQIPWTADADGDVLSVSSRWVKLTAVSQSDALGRGWLQAVHHDDLKSAIDDWKKALATGRPLDINYRLRIRDGGYRWVRARASARRDETGRIVRWYGTVEDVHEYYLANNKIILQAYQDELTGLPNRRSFVDELRRRLEVAGAVGLVVLDMDDFKLVNDRHGHLVGDAILRLFARYLRRVADPNEFVARLGGDEFAVICPQISTDPLLLERAHAFETGLDSYLKRNMKTRLCKPSLGCALGVRGENPDEVFKRADLALYAAKAAGKGTVKIFDASLRSAASKRSEALELARTALRENWVEAFYQPIVALDDQHIRGFEALLRIRHPEQGLLAPIAIQGAFDDPRVADAIGIRMAHLVTQNLSKCQSSGISCGQISINLATENLVNTEFISLLLNLLEEKNLPYRSIKLEITERVLMDEMGHSVVENLKRLRDSGVGISLDDFGTGYASLVHLRTLPVDEIKIDRSFVSGLGTITNRGEIVQAMLGLAKALGLSTVAEGIETDSEAVTLAGWGCGFGQGYLFARPMPFEAALTFLKDRKS